MSRQFCLVVAVAFGIAGSVLAQGTTTTSGRRHGTNPAKQRRRPHRRPPGEPMPPHRR